MATDRATKVFISYSRRDRRFITKLQQALEGQTGIEVFRDTEDILPTEEWKGRLEQLISQADTVVFALSPHSASSDVCAWEIEYAESLNKRIAPIVIRTVDPASVPPVLNKYHYIFFLDGREFDTAVRNLVSALNTDIDWIREHTRLGEQARRWDNQRKPSASLLRGEELAAAEHWLASQPSNAPAPTPLHQEFVQASRGEATRRQRRIFGISIVAAVTAILLAAYALVQQNVARENERVAARERDRAVEAEAAAENERQRAEQQRDDALRSESLFLSDAARTEMRNGDATAAILLAQEGLRDLTSDNPTQRQRPFVVQAQEALSTALNARKEIAILRKDGRELRAFGFSPDGRLVLASNDDGALYLISATASDIVDQIEARGSPISDARFSPDGKQVAVTYGDGVVVVRDAGLGEPVVTINDEATGILLTEYALSGNGFATLSADGTVRIRDAATGIVQRSIRDPDEKIRSFALSPDGRHIVTIGENLDTTRLWDTASGAVVAVLGEQSGGVWEAGFSRSGSKMVLACVDGTVRIWDVGEAEEIAVFEGHGEFVGHAEFSPDESRVVSAALNGSVLLWDPRSGETIASLSAVSVESSFFAGFSPDGTLVVTSGDDGRVHIWDASLGNPVASFGGHLDVATWAALSFDNSRLLSTSADGTARLWFSHRETAAHDLNGHGGELRHAGFSPDGREVVTASTDGKARIFSVADTSLQAEIDASPSEVSWAEYSHDGTLVGTASADGYGRLWNRASGELVAELHADDSAVTSIRFSPDDTKVLTTDGANVRVWDASSATLRWAEPASFFDVTAGVFSPDGAEVAAVDAVGSTIVMSAETGATRVFLESDRTKLTSVDWSVDGRTVAAGSALGIIQLWNAVSGTSTATFAAHNSSVTGVSFFDGGKHFLTSSLDGTARMWNLDSGDLLGIYDNGAAPLRSVAVAPDGTFMVVAAENGTASVWPLFLDPQSLIDHVRQVVPRCLTLEQRNEFHLTPEPPAWCVEMGKWPYDTDEWRTWLVEKHAGGNPEMPN